MLTNNQPEDIIQPMIVLNALNAKLKGETPMTDTMMIRDCIRSQGMKLGHVAHVLASPTTPSAASWKMRVNSR